MEDEIARLRRRLRDDPRSTAFVALAEALRRQERAPEALAVLRNGFRHHPDHGPGRVVLARVHLDLGNRALALGVIEEVVQHDPNNLAALAMLARMLVEDGRARDARPLVERLEMAGDPSAAELARASVVPSFDGINRTDPFDSPRLGERWQARGDYTRARGLWERLAAANPNHGGLSARVDEIDALTLGTTAADAERGPGERAMLPGMRDLEVELDRAERAQGVPPRLERYGALGRALWRSS